MRTDIFWSAVWGTCFVGGVVIGTTGSARVMAARTSASPKLRGSDVAAAVVPGQSKESASPSLLAESTAGQKDNTIEAAPAIIPEQQQHQDDTVKASADSHRTLTSQMQEQGAQRIRALNGGLWGPNEEEEREIAQGLFRLDEVEDTTTPNAWPSVPMENVGNGDGNHDEEGVLRAAAAAHQSFATFSYFYEDDDELSYDFEAKPQFEDDDKLSYDFKPEY